MNRHRLILFFAILVKLVLQFALVLPEYELHRDEFLHIDQGKHLAWGYVSVPPLTSWTSWLVLQFGAPELLVRLIPALWGAATLVLIYKMVKLLGGNAFALSLALSCAVFSGLMRLNMLYQPNSADVFFWTLLFYLLMAYSKWRTDKYLYFTALAFAFGMLNKYNIAILALSLFAGLAVAGPRHIFFEKHLYLAAALALAILLPHLYWQFSNHFPVIAHMAELRETQLINVDRMDFIKDQILFFAGAIWVVAAGLIALSRPESREFRFIPVAFVTALLLFTLMRAKGYYAVGLYPVLLAAGAVAFGKLRNRVLRAALLIFPALLFAAIVDVAFPLRSAQFIAQNPGNYQKLGMLTWEDGKQHALPQDFADMLGWKELAQKVSAATNNLSGSTLILCDNYGQAGAINYYAPGRNAVSRNADYVNWFPRGKIDHVIWVREAQNAHPRETLGKFRIVRRAGKIENPYARESGSTIYLLKE